jgi:hypothetical protein
MLNLHVCVLNRHAVWYGYNAAQCVDLKRIRLIVFQTASCRNSTRAYRNHTRLCHDHTHTCQNQTLLVEITLVRVEITVMSVVITFVHVEITMRVKITLCLQKPHP